MRGGDSIGKGKGKGDGRSGLPSRVSAIASPASAVGPPASHFPTLPTGHLHFFPSVTGDWTTPNFLADVPT
jgi:hypothetical protein